MGGICASFAAELQDVVDHGADAVEDQVHLGLAHERRGRHHLVLLVHVGLVTARSQVKGNKVAFWLLKLQYQILWDVPKSDQTC